MTSDNYDYTRGYVGRVPTGVTSALITVTASNDAHVSLGDSLEHDGRHWEIVLGGWGNTQSVIRPRNQGPALATHHGAVLHAGAPRQFWVSWGDGSLRVGEGTAPGAREMMAVALTEGPGGAIEQMHVATGWGSSGRWSVSLESDDGAVLDEGAATEALARARSTAELLSALRGVRRAMAADSDAVDRAAYVDAGRVAKAGAGAAWTEAVAREFGALLREF